MHTSHKIIIYARGKYCRAQWNSVPFYSQHDEKIKLLYARDLLQLIKEHYMCKLLFSLLNELSFTIPIIIHYYYLQLVFYYYSYYDDINLVIVD